MTSLWPVGDERMGLEHYGRGLPRWCAGCGDNAVLAAVQRLCRDQQLVPEKTVCVSGIGCSSRLPHYLNVYGFHAIHGRALPVAEGIKLSRPELDVIVVTGDGDCCSIGTAHWIHAIRYNIDMTVLVLDNGIYGLTKNQASPTSPRGLKTNTTPRGAFFEPMNPLSVTLGVVNASFVAQAVDWIPDVLSDILRLAFLHRGFSFIRVLLRCQQYLPDAWEPWIRDPGRIRLLVHENGLQPAPVLAGIYRNTLAHDPSNLARAREVAAETEPIPVGILYRNPEAPRYEQIRDPERICTAEDVRTTLEREFDKFTIQPAH
jgi:2-oxoglutarate ferredoxin oxidoreductase subunit beta